MGDIQFLFRNEGERRRWLAEKRKRRMRKLQEMQQSAREEAEEIGDKDSFDTFGDNDGALFGP